MLIIKIHQMMEKSLKYSMVYASSILNCCLHFNISRRYLFSWYYRNSSVSIISYETVLNCRDWLGSLDLFVLIFKLIMAGMFPTA